MSRSSGKRRRLKKKLKQACSSPPCGLGLASLPIEIALSCLARVSRSDYPSLSMVSKSHRSLMLSPELEDVRSQMGITETCNFLCLSIPSDQFVRWFAFCPKPLNRPRQLVPIRPHLYQPSEESSVVALGGGIYIMGGRIYGRRSSRVFFLDCRSHTWTNLPSMGVPRESAAAGVFDGKIYVLGGCKDENSPRWGEVFDPKTQTWDPLPMPPDEDNVREPLMFESAVIKDKVFAENATGRYLFYIPSEGKWKKGNMDTSGDQRGLYVIENVMYCCLKDGRILWCDASELEWRESEVMEWREVMGLEAIRDHLRASRLVKYGGLISDNWEAYKRRIAIELGIPITQLESEGPDDGLPGYKLSNSGPNMLLFWDVRFPLNLQIWCTEISLKRCKETCEIWGNIEWSEAVMTRDTPRPHRHPHRHHCKILYSLSLNL